MNVIPLDDRVLVKPKAPKEKIGSLYIPQGADEPDMATVIAVGPGKQTLQGKILPMMVKTGDLVLISKYAGTTIQMNQENHLIVRETDILAIVEPDHEDGKEVK